jgi:hypothetical protein
MGCDYEQIPNTSRYYYLNFYFRGYHHYYSITAKRGKEHN